MQHSEETAAAVAKAVAQVNEGWQRKMQTAANDVALRKWCVEQAFKFQHPVAAAIEIHRFITEPMKEGNE